METISWFLSHVTLWMVIFILASSTWRISNLVANESGPFGVFEDFRRIAGVWTKHVPVFRAFHFYDGLTCEWCNSIWFGTINVGLWLLLGNVYLLPLLILTVSTWVIIIKYVVHMIENCQEYVYLQIHPATINKPTLHNTDHHQDQVDSLLYSFKAMKEMYVDKSKGDKS